jgi:hypothetical protein
MELVVYFWGTSVIPGATHCTPGSGEHSVPLGQQLPLAQQVALANGQHRDGKFSL